MDSTPEHWHAVDVLFICMRNNLLATETNVPVRACRKRALLLFLHSTRQRLLRILIIAKWTNKVHIP